MPENEDDESLTQRERRALRHQQTRRKDRPAEMKRALRAYGPVALIVVVVAAAAAGVFWLSTSTSKDCPDPHWHATAAVYLPGKVQVDMASPRSVSGLPYYDWDTHLKGEGNRRFNAALHMHQTGGETGSAALGPSQWHMEKDGVCVGVKNALYIVEIEASEDSLTLVGGHEQVPGQSGKFEASENSPLRWFVQDVHGAWGERTWGQVSGYQLQDGESLLVAMGSYTDLEIQEMQSKIPVPISRAQVLAGHATSAPSTSATTTSAPAASTTSTASATNSTAPQKPGAPA